MPIEGSGPEEIIHQNLPCIKCKSAFTDNLGINIVGSSLLFTLAIKLMYSYSGYEHRNLFDVMLWISFSTNGVVLVIIILVLFVSDENIPEEFSDLLKIF